MSVKARTRATMMSKKTRIGTRCEQEEEEVRKEWSGDERKKSKKGREQKKPSV